MIKFEEVSKIYQNGNKKIYALNKVSFTINKGEFVIILGPSGAGKSTLLNILGGIDRLDEGKIIIDNEVISNKNENELSDYRAHQVGFIFQFFNLIPVLTAQENIEMPVLLDNEKIDKKYMNELLRILGLEERKNNYPSQLSGGQQQRVSIGRALANKPSIILADEPTGNLDSKNSHELLSLFRDLNINDGVSILMVTHDSKIASYSSKLLYIKDGVIDETIERKDMSQKEYFYKIVDINSTESQVLFD